MAGGGMWVTLDLLGGRTRDRDLVNTVDEWLETVTVRIAAASADTGTPTSVGVPELPEESLQRSTSSFNHPHVRARLEELMGSNIVRVTDRAYMQRLQQRIHEDHVTRQQERIAVREAEEVEREKRLILQGKIPMEEAPKELADHPVLLISQITKKIAEERSIKRKTVLTSPNFYPSLTTLSEGEEREGAIIMQERVAEGDLSLEDQLEEVEDPERKYMLTPEQYEKLKYESPLIKQLRNVETVVELYKLADEIVGPLKKGENPCAPLTLK